MRLLYHIAPLPPPPLSFPSLTKHILVCAEPYIPGPKLGDGGWAASLIPVYSPRHDQQQ